MNWDKVYLMPEVFNALRQELSTNWPASWEHLQGYMAWDGPMFVQEMDKMLDTVTQFDTDNVHGMCAKFLDKLREKRGLSALHTVREYKNNDAMESDLRLARDMNEVAPWLLPPVKRSKQ